MKKILILILSIVSFAQMDMDFQSDLFNDEIQNKLTQKGAMDQKQMPVASTLIPDLYMVGPGDFFNLKVAPLPSDELITVDVEGNITLPKTYGMIKASGLTLSELKEQVSEIITAKNKKFKVYLSLVKPRSCLVRVKGNIDKPGIYPFPASFRVSDVLAFLENRSDMPVSVLDIAKQQNSYKINKDKNRYFDYSNYPLNTLDIKRNITLISETGEISNCDIVLSNIDPKTNPYIQQGQTISVPYEMNPDNYYIVNGEVNSPSKIYYKTDDDLTKAIFLADGLTENADRSNIEIIRNDGNIETVSMDDNVRLFSGNTVVVKKLTEENRAKKNFATVSGEVNNPGTFKVEEGMRLSELIEMAGGITGSACLNLSTLNNEKQYKPNDFAMNFDELELMQYFDLTVEDTARIRIDALLRKPTASVNFNKALNDPGSQEDVIIRAGDYIEISECPDRIYVLGHLLRPGYVDFVPGMEVDHYVNMAGGYSTSADKGRIRIIRGGSKAWVIPKKGTKIYQGDIIYVPSEPVESAMLKSQRFLAYTGIVGAVAQIGSLALGILNYLFWTRDQ